jgi:putative endonuclease
MSAVWHLYLLECRTGKGTSLYAGITTDLDRRYAEHTAGTGARYTRAHPPIRLLATRVYPDRSSASKAEAALKKLSRVDKPGFFSAPCKSCNR